MTGGSGGDEYLPPSCERVAARALALAAQTYRAVLERQAKDPGAAGARAKCVAWCERIGLRPEFEAAEWTLLTTPVGKLRERDAMNASWLAEPMACLAWALRVAELPDYETEADGPDTANALHFLDDDALKSLARAKLRPRADLERLRDTYLTLHWRLRQFSLRPEHIDFAKFARECEWANMRLEDLRIEAGDLSVAGLPLVAAPERVRRTRQSIASERHRAAEWLLGQNPLYSQVTTDT